MTYQAIRHFLIEFIPTIGFFVATQITDFFNATVILMILSFLSLTMGWLIEKKLPALPIIITIFVIISGALTVIYKNPDILILSNSIYYLLFSLILILGLVFKFNILKYIFNKTFAIYEEGWHILTIRWALILGLIGIGNEFIRILHTPDIWIIYKLFSNVLLIIFAFFQFTVSRKYRIPKFSNSFGIRTRDEI